MTALPANSVERLRDVLQELQKENVALRIASRQGELLFCGLQALLAVDADADAFSIAFESLHRVYTFSTVVALVETDERLECIASDQPDFLGTVWASTPLLRKVLKGRTVATVAGVDTTYVEDQPTLIHPRQPALFLPIHLQEKRGAMVLLRDQDGEGFSRDDIALGQKYALLASHALAIRNRAQREQEHSQLQKLTKELEHRAFYDELTGLANRALVERLANERLVDRDPAAGLALMFLDVNKFKRINDYFGHTMGDNLLAQMADRIRSVLRDSDVLARISGDEFVLLAEPLRDRAELDALIDTVSRAINQPYDIEGHRITATAALGVAVWPEHGQDYESLRRNADNAMYRAKVAGRDRPVFYTSEMGRDLTGRMELERRLRSAVERGAFTCAFQPKIAIRDRRVTGFEALARWTDENGVLRPPGDFIQAATEIGVLDHITHAVADACIAAFDRLDPVYGENTTIAINVAGVQANDHEFMRALVTKFIVAGCSHRIMLELTEDAMVQAPQFRSLVDPLLEAGGIRLAVDDFGTGYSSLSVLANIRANELKIDRSFISDIHRNATNQRILLAIVRLASAIGLVTVAEGVETAEELDYLEAESTVDLVQGYYFARPMAISELADRAVAARLKARDRADVQLRPAQIA